jgi:uncharacterized membrane protein
MHFPASVWKARSFGLVLGLQMALAVFVGLVNPAPAAAQLTVCNNTRGDVTVAFSKTWDSTVPGLPAVQTMINGFYQIAGGQCRIVEANPLLVYNTYLLAWEDNNPKVRWNGQFQRCVPKDSRTWFEYHNEKAHPPCGAGQRQEGVFWVTNGYQTRFTQTLDEPSATAPAAPPAQPNPPPAAPAPRENPPTPGSTLTGTPAGIRNPGKAVTSTPNAPTGNAVLVVTSGLAPQPGGQNPLAGHTFVLLNQSYENVLAGAGIQAPAGVSPVKGFLAACTNHQPACQVGVAATNSSTVSGTKADASGKAQLPGVPPGTYYFFCLGGYNNHLLKWDFQVQLKPGTNSVTLDEHNAALVN